MIAGKRCSQSITWTRAREDSCVVRASRSATSGRRRPTFTRAWDICAKRREHLLHQLVGNARVEARLDLAEHPVEFGRGEERAPEGDFASLEQSRSQST